MCILVYLRKRHCRVRSSRYYQQSRLRRIEIKHFLVHYFTRGLRLGPTFGINALENYAPASLLKLPLALAYLSLADTYPGLLEKKIGYTGTTTSPLEQTFPPAVSIESGHFYSIRDMIFNMLVYSDNKSYTVLGNYFENDI